MDTIGIANTPCTVVVLGLAARELLVAIAGNERQVAQASPDTTRTRQGRERHVDTKKLGQQGAALDQQTPQTTPPLQQQQQQQQQQQPATVAKTCANCACTCRLVTVMLMRYICIHSYSNTHPLNHALPCSSCKERVLVIRAEQKTYIGVGLVKH